MRNERLLYIGEKTSDMKCSRFLRLGGPGTIPIRPGSDAQVRCGKHSLDTPVHSFILCLRHVSDLPIRRL